MRLTKLEMYGFKSFARKTEIVFDDGITAIIGPNGSGKSNIADAVRWVLGEQSAKALRGEKMEDIIFNGTEAKKPLSYGEVSLTFDNSDHELATDYNEVCVTRRIYRSGESEYFINRSSCRRKDIAELFRDTGVGKEGYSIIGQGRVEQILSAKSADRRSAFEEAAGVMKYRVRKEEAARKLENTRGNMDRLSDIIEELSRQVGPLEEQSAAAREYLKLRDELKEIEINVFLYQYDKLNERIKTLNEAIASANEQIREKEGIEASIASSCSEEEELERALNSSISAVQSELLAMTTGVEGHAGESKVLSERMEAFMREKEQRQSQLEENEKRHADLLKALNCGKANIERTDEELEQLRCEAAVASGELQQLSKDVEQKEEKLEEQKAALIDAMNRIADARILISRFETMRQSLVEQAANMAKNKKQAEEKWDELKREYAEAEHEHNALLEQKAERKKQREDAIQALNNINQRLKEASEAARAAEQESSSGKSRLKVLEEMKRAHEGYYASVKNLLRDSERDFSLKQKIEGVVAELISVPGEYETAIEMSLGPALQNIVTPDENDAKAVIEHLRRKGYGRATFLPVSVMRPRILEQRELNCCRVKGFIGVASELVSFDEKYRGIIENLLGKTVIVNDLDAAIAINRQAHSSFRIATLKGDIVNPGGSMTGGSVQKREFSIIGREREIEELTKRTAELDKEKLEREKEYELLEASLSGAQEQLEATGDALHEKELEIAAHAEKLDIIEKYMQEAKNALAAAEEGENQINDDIADIDARFEAAKDDRSTLEQSNTATQADIRNAQQELMQLKARLANATEHDAERRVALAKAEKEAASLKNEFDRIAKEEKSVSAAIEDDRRVISGFADRFMELGGKLEEIEGSISEERKAVDRLTDRLHTMEEERARRLQTIDELRLRRESISIEAKDLSDRLHKNELGLSRAEMELKSSQDKMWEDYELTYENALPYRRQIAVAASHIRIDELKKSIKALGDVNISAIDDYKSVKERFDTMSAQYGDLTAAEADLRQLIDELTKTMENEFRRQFEKIQDNFSSTFAELFGGGKAELVLSDKNDILNCNIDIIAQPPGKKLQLLSLLSGGERALTAIALLFAILKLKPTAFCILDEIETSLDEVNVSTFAQYVQRYSKDTQFIMITHRKGSMEVCNALYGVAMEERGISKVVSARFNG